MLQIEIKLAYHDGEIIVTDTTGLYGMENTTGWGGMNLERSEVHTALITIKRVSDEPISFDVTEDVTGSALEEIIFPAFEAKEDGIYRVNYSINDEITALNWCYVHGNIKKELSKMWAHLAGLYNSYEYRDLAHECILIDAHVRSLDMLSNRRNNDKYLTIMRICQERIAKNKEIFNL